MTLIFGRNWQSWITYLTCCFVTDEVLDEVLHVNSFLIAFGVAFFWVLAIPTKLTFTTKEK